MSLEKYNKKRDFKKSPEPRGSMQPSEGKPVFVIQRHNASRLHYDFRLEHNGVLISWAIPKKPVTNPDVKRLAIHVEDHPIEYGNFEGTIPEGEYGAGEVAIWDRGTYSYADEENPDETHYFIEKGLKKGHVKITLNGDKLKGVFSLINIDDKDSKQDMWLFFKNKEQKHAEIDEDYAQKIIEYAKGKGWAKKKEIPKESAPQLATLYPKPFDDPDWFFEVKFDGYRALLKIDDGNTTLLSRNGKDLTQKFKPIIAAFKDYPHNAVFDGELTVNDKSGVSNWEMLREYISTQKGNPVFNIFDCTYFDEYDITKAPLTERKHITRQIVPVSKHLLYVEHISGDQGKTFFKEAEKLGVEGIMGKLRSSTYKYATRTDSWRKIKVSKELEAVIIGYQKSSKGSLHFGSLLLGAYDHGELIYIGKVGTGFSSKLRDEIYKKLAKIERKSAPVREEPSQNNDFVWVSAKYTCTVSYSEITKDSKLRHPSFKKLSKTHPKDAHLPAKTTVDIPGGDEQKIEKDLEINGKKVHITNQAKVFWPKENLTKGDVILYYSDIADVILPYLKDRPESMHRTPNGTADRGFYQKDLEDYHPEWIIREVIHSKDEDKKVHYLVCQNKETLVYMANLGCVELHPWHSRVGKLNYPDYVIFDLDPHGIDFSHVVDVALSIHELCDTLNLPHFIKTSGIAGLHIYLPLEQKYTYTQAHQFIAVLAQIINKKHPETTSLVRSPRKRRHKIYLDIGQNRKGQTIVAPYALRPIPGAPASIPLEWGEVNKKLDPQLIKMKGVERRLDKKGDLWKGLLSEKIKIELVIPRLEELL